MKRLAGIVAFTVALLLSALAYGQVAPVSRAPVIPPATPIVAHNGMVVAQESRASRIGVEILDRGGNAVDAAVAVGFALAVTYPRAGNIGGGGFMLIHLAKGNRDMAIDYRETAPSAATATMLLDAKGEPDPAKSRDSALAVGVPGTVAGLALAREKYGSGKLSLADLIAPAIRLAQQGFPVEDDTADSLPRARERLARWPSSAGIFLKDGGKPPQTGDRLLQFDLADTLKAIAQDGPQAFYQGRIAAQIAAAVRGAGGIMTADDLKNYRAVERPPVRGTYRGYDIVSMPPPSSGGVHLIEMLNILEGYDLAKRGRGEQSLHTMIEAMKRAFADRAVFMGDPDAVKMPITGLISKKYAAALRAGIGDKATPAASIRPGKRPLSSMTPTIVLKDGKPVLVTGSPGGSRIISAVLQVITNVIDFHMPIDKAVTAPRLHHQWQPDEVFAEPGFAPDVLDALKTRGHSIVATEPHTSANSIQVTPNGTVGSADTRTRGALAAGY